MNTGRQDFDRPVTAGEIAELLGAECLGARDTVLKGVSSLESAGPEHLAFAAGERWLRLLESTCAGAVLVSDQKATASCVLLRHPDARGAFARVMATFISRPWPLPVRHTTASVHQTVDVTGVIVDAFAVIEEGASIGAGSWIGAHAYIGRGVSIGRQSHIMPHAVIMDGCEIGDRVRVFPGAVVGADGFGHVPTSSTPIRVPHLGNVMIEDDVEIGANSCIDRGVLGPTHIGKGSRLDNLVQVAHGVRMGANCLLAAFAGVAGGARLGANVVMAGRSAVVNGIDVGDRAVFAGLASASKNVPAGRRLGGSPARNYQQWLREFAALRKLPKTLRAIDQLQRRMDALDVVDEGTEP